MLARIERHEASTLVVYRFDWLARALLVQLTVTDRLGKVGAQVVSRKEPDIDGPDELRELIRNILGSVAGYERAVIQGWMVAGKAQKVAKGGYGGSRPPFGPSVRWGQGACTRRARAGSHCIHASAIQRRTQFPSDCGGD